MLPNGHKIADARFNIVFASPDGAIRGAAVLPGLIREQLVPCMENVLNRWGADPEVVRIDRLAVDLGTVDHEDMARGLAQRLEQALHAALQERLGAEPTCGAKAVRRIPQHQACLDLIAHYLETGTVPWTVEKFSSADLNRLLETAIDQAPQTLVAFLRSQTQKAGPVLPRLTRQFEPDLLLRIAAHLAPAVALPLTRLVSVLADLHRSATSAPATDRQWIGGLWEAILGQMLSPGGRSMTLHTLVANALLATAARHNISRRWFYRRLTQAWQRNRTSAAGSAVEQLVAQVLQQLALEGADHDASQPTTDPWPPLKSKLLDAIVHHRMDGFDRAWQVMVTRFAGPTRQVIRQTARQSQVRRTIARRFAPQQFRQLVVLLEPRHGRFINNVLEHQKTLGQAMHRASDTPETMGVHLREFTLAYLLSEGATRFNRRQYCAAAIRGLAARHNMAYEALLDDFHTFFAGAVATGDDTGRRLKEILDEIRANSSGTQSPPPQESSPPPGISSGRPARLRTCSTSSAAAWQGLDSEKTNTSIAFDGALPEEIRAVLGLDITQSGLTAALKKLAARHPRWSKFLSYALLEMDRDLDPAVLIQHLSRCLQKAGGAIAPDAYCQELRHEPAVLNSLTQSADGPSMVSETACRQCLSENQTMAFDGSLPKEIREVPGGGIGRSGLTAALKKLAARHPRWSGLFTQALLGMGRDLDPAALMQPFARCLKRAGRATAPGAFYSELHRELFGARSRTQDAGRPPAQMAGGRRIERETSVPVASQNRRTWRRPEAAAPDQSVFIQNAGLVLVAPYLPRLFGMLGLTAKSRFNSRTLAERAVHLLEFIANERTTAPEFQLVLNKVLCGVAAATPIISGIDITPKEQSAVDSLIRSIIEHWKILGNTSPEGLRTTFLQREGYLTLKEDAWHLRVVEGSFDMLLDRLPWSYAVIKHPWMTRMLYVNWRLS